MHYASAAKHTSFPASLAAEARQATNLTTQLLQHPSHVLLAAVAALSRPCNNAACRHDTGALVISVMDQYTDSASRDHPGGSHLASEASATEVEPARLPTTQRITPVTLCGVVREEIIPDSPRQHARVQPGTGLTCTSAFCVVISALPEIPCLVNFKLCEWHEGNVIDTKLPILASATCCRRESAVVLEPVRPFLDYFFDPKKHLGKHLIKLT